MRGLTMNGQVMTNGSNGHEAAFTRPHHPELEQLVATMPNATIDSLRSQSRMSISHAKGLLNMPGQNNCFLNSAVQVLWHLDIFRRSFRELHGHACMGDSCIFCALKELFNQFQSSTESALPPDSLRFALAEAFSDQRRFQLGYMDDAAECFENILLRIHYHLTNNEVNDGEPQCQEHCIPHQKFAMNLSEQIVCHSCGATSEPFVFSQMVHYASTTALCSQAKLYKSDNSLSFGSLLKMATSMGDVRNCPKICGTRMNIRKVLVNRPDVISVGLVWDSEHPTLTFIRSVFQLIETNIKLSQVFDLSNHSTEDAASETPLNLVGLVTYYGKHYSTYLYHTKLSEWIYFDDATVRVIGPSWSQVVEKCLKGRFQPLLLLYANPNGAAVSTRYAFKDIVPMTAIKKTSRPSALKSPTASAKLPLLEPIKVEGHSQAVPFGGKSLYLDVPDSPSATSTTSYFSDLGDSTDGYISRKTVENILKIQQHNKKKEQSDLIATFNKRHNRNSSSSLESFDSAIRMSSLSRHHSIESNLICSLQRRDSGNSSGDRSSSVSSVDTPFYSYRKASLKNGQLKSSKHSDQGYDSFSLSSSDSFPSTAISPSKVSGHKLKQIPEDVQLLEMGTASPMTECDKLCSEVEVLLLKSHEKEREGDLRAAAALSDSAAAKARIAMDAPYSNHKALISAKMKHSMCVLRSTSLHKRVQELEAEEKRFAKAQEYHHVRQSSRDSTHGRHSRQGSRDSKDPTRAGPITPPKPLPTVSPVVNLELYATLPKRNKRKSLLKTSNGNLTNEEPSNLAVSLETTAQIPYSLLEKLRKEAMYIATANKSTKSGELVRESDFSDYYSEWEGIKKKSMAAKGPVAAGSGWQSCRENDSEVYGEIGITQANSSRKQCKVKRKLLLGGLLKSKNRSMPDLREDSLQEKSALNGNPPVVARNDSFSNMGNRSAVANIHRGFHVNAGGNRGKASLVKVKPPLLSEISPVACKMQTDERIYANLKSLGIQPLGARAYYNQSVSDEELPLPPPPVDSELENQPTNPFLLELNKKRAEIMAKMEQKAKQENKLSKVLENQPNIFKKPSTREIATFISRNTTTSQANTTLAVRMEQMAISARKPACHDASPYLRLPIQMPIPIHANNTASLPSQPSRPSPPDYETTIKRIVGHNDQMPAFPVTPPLSHPLYSQLPKKATPVGGLGMPIGEKPKTANPSCHSLNRANAMATNANPAFNNLEVSDYSSLNRKMPHVLPLPSRNSTNSKLKQAARCKALSKKSVTFSDEIEWVACAGDNDQEEHLPNPLLEKVLSNKNVVYTLQQ